MISIILSSVNKNQLRLVTDNIQKTIGVPFELIAFDNHEGKEGICEIYNRGIAQARFPILCFMHEDVLIRTVNWGKKVADYFEKNKELGLIGVAGKTSKSSVASSWDTPYGTSYVHLIQHFKYVDKPAIHIVEPHKGKHELNQVAWVDGVWMCAHKKAANIGLFDSNLKGFHGYDIDFSLQIGEQYTVAVSHEILLEHFSEGNFSADWLESMIYIQEKWRKQLPLNLQSSDVDLKRLEKQTFRYLIKKYKEEFNISFREGHKILNASRIREFGLGLYMKMYFSLIRILMLDRWRVRRWGQSNYKALLLNVRPKKI